MCVCVCVCVYLCVCKINAFYVCLGGTGERQRGWVPKQTTEKGRVKYYNVRENLRVVHP